MKTTVVSDIHLEFGHIPSLPGGDLLLLCGDTVVTDHLVSNHKRHRDIAKKFFSTEVSKYRRALVLMGNHEHYHGCIDDSATIYRSFLAKHAPHATLLDEETVVIGGIAFIGSTLWSTCRIDDDPVSEIGVSMSMSDFRVIRKAIAGSTYTARFTTSDARARHEKAVAYIQSELPKHDRVVVLTHHAPSYRCNTKYKVRGQWNADALTPGYCSELDGMIEASPNIEFWVHGHTHEDSNFLIGKTRVLSNQHGYWGSERIAEAFDAARGEINFDCEVAA